MAFVQIDGSLLQYDKDIVDGGGPASGFFIKLYNASNIAISMYSDRTGAGALDKSQLDSSGYPLNGSLQRFTPFIDQDYKATLYSNATDADNDNFILAVWQSQVFLLPAEAGATSLRVIDNVSNTKIQDELGNTGITLSASTSSTLDYLNLVRMNWNSTLINMLYQGSSVQALRVEATQIKLGSPDGLSSAVVSNGSIVNSVASGSSTTSLSATEFAIVNGGTTQSFNSTSVSLTSPNSETVLVLDDAGFLVNDQSSTALLLLKGSNAELVANGGDGIRVSSSTVNVQKNNNGLTITSTNLNIGYDTNAGLTVSDTESKLESPDTNKSITIDDTDLDLNSDTEIGITSTAGTTLINSETFINCSGNTTIDSDLSTTILTRGVGGILIQSFEDDSDIEIKSDNDIRFTLGLGAEYHVLGSTADGTGTRVLYQCDACDFAVNNFSCTSSGGIDLVNNASSAILLHSASGGASFPSVIISKNTQIIDNDVFLSFKRTANTSFIQMDNVGGLAFNPASSDRRLKSEYSVIEGVLERVSKAKVYRGDYLSVVKKGDNFTVHDKLYFIADELQDQFPELVMGDRGAVDSDSNPVYQTVEHGTKKEMLMWAALGEANERLVIQQSQIDILTAEFKELRSKLDG